VFLDLGFSSLQVDNGERGFSFLRPGPLDMRMDQRQDLRAADVINRASEAELRQIFRDLGEEPAAGALARAVVRARAAAPVTTTAALVETIARVVKRTPRSHLHPATRAFQALRIAVNQELDHLTAFLRAGYRLLRPGGRMVILSYHSLEDRLVKEAFRRWAATCLCPPQVQVCVCGWSPQVRILTPKPLMPAPEEIAVNPRARSARLRAVERLSAAAEG
jgi:16S rRNA (cytosine1402-N4)-methyltransferase